MYCTIDTAASRGLRHPLAQELWQSESDSLRRAFLRIDQVRDLEIQGQVGFEVLGVAGIYCSDSM
jgi:hypothetical protein